MLELDATTTTTTPRLSVIIPAHDEEAVIEATLRSVLASTIAEQLDILVVCNGCTDSTAALARAASPRVRVVETEVAGKHVALNLGDDHALAAHRVYLDADTQVTPGALEAVADLLDGDGALAASPLAAFDVAHCSWPARQSHRIWRQGPYYRSGTLGAGFYGLSAAGRARFDRFPPVVGDDYFMANLFAPHERRTAHDHSFVPVLPATVRSMVRVHVRHYGAHAELDEWWDRSGRGPRPEWGTSGHRWLLGLVPNPANWPGLVIYGAVKVLAIPLGRRKHRRRQMSEWNRDEAGRRAAQR